ncbi:hypothetical protein [Candidatus Nitrosocosmicus hydrocola]|uniref:hypothetical protein n=1 Tax=Candidatus Nitrosocosmicus hydrocola TaxID=1826872 RepID=UPI0011E5FC94|nr:hypothetical protein [Candidatus Nitrosocosmicus hydrocola]
MTISLVATLLLTTMSLTNISNVNADALDLLNNLGGIDDIGQSAECVIVVVGCDGTGSVGSSGDTIIGSNNGNGDNDTNGGEDGILTVSKEVTCESVGGQPNNTAVCDFAVTSANFPGPEDFEITVTGNNPNPDTFDGSVAGIPVNIEDGNYVITETLADTSDLQNQLTATSIITETTAEGDCTPNFNVNQVFQDATGTMTSGGSQDCTLINNILINGGDVPIPPPEI